MTYLKTPQPRTSTSHRYTQMHIHEAAATCLEALSLAGNHINSDMITVKDFGCPHVPQELPPNKMAVYTFKKDGKYLKIGKVGSRAGARYKYQHYSPASSKSNLAKSILQDPDMLALDVNEANVSDWIKREVHREDILIEEKAGVFVLNFMEAFLHCVFTPKYEGFPAQRR